MSICANQNDRLGKQDVTSPDQPTSITDVPIASMRVDPGYNARVEGNHAEHVSRLLESDPADWPPILVSQDDDGRLVVLDGNHRVAAATQLGLTVLRCRIIEGGGYPEAFDANRLHRLPLSVDDRKEYAVWLHEEKPELSLREIGRRAGLHHRTVKAALEGLEPPEECTRDAAALSILPPRSKQPVADRLVTLVLHATDANEGVGLFGRDRRAAVIRKVIKEYEQEARSEIAQAVHAWGTAMQVAAQPFLDAG